MTTIKLNLDTIEATYNGFNIDDLIKSGFDVEIMSVDFGRQRAYVAVSSKLHVHHSEIPIVIFELYDRAFFSASVAWVHVLKFMSDNFIQSFTQSILQGQWM